MTSRTITTVETPARLHFGRREVLLCGAAFGACAHFAPGATRSTQRARFVGGPTGRWKVERSVALRGAGLAQVAAVELVEGAPVRDASAQWVLEGVRSNERYVTRDEKTRLLAPQQGLGRSSSTSAVLIPMSKSKTWWDLPQDERRAIIEDRSHHFTIGSRYLPAIARRLFHGRDLAAEFDFITWFEFAPTETQAFDDLVGALRSTEEWRFVEREVELRLALRTG